MCENCIRLELLLREARRERDEAEARLYTLAKAIPVVG